jgi:hypothetical protein
VAFELFVPVYGSELGQNASVAERRQFVGWAAGQFRAGDFLHAALQSTTPTTGVELHDERVGPGSLVASEPEGFRAGGPDVRETRFTSGERIFVLRYAPLAGNPILTERTIPASLLLGAGVGVSVLLGALLWLLAQVGSLYREVGRLARTDKGTCSIGVATWDRREEATALVARADRALYAAKKGGRNRSCADPAEAAEPVARAQG